MGYWDFEKDSDRTCFNHLDKHVPDSIRKEARKELIRWCEKIKKSANKNIYPLKKVIDTIYEWENQIVNSFIISDELGGNITNGIVEAKNNVAKTIIKSSYGKNDFKKFRKQFLESERIRKERK